MVCPRCRREGPAKAGRCAACGAALTEATGVGATIAIDTTGLPPGATFGPTADPLPDGPAAPRLDAPTGDAGTIDATALTGFEPASAPKAAGPLGVGQSFSARYHIIKLLGAGGMGAVYQAWDAELGVSVALKVIASRSAQWQRLLRAREAVQERAAARASGHAQERRPDSRPRGDRRHQVHHDAVRPGR